MVLVLATNNDRKLDLSTSTDDVLPYQSKNIEDQDSGLSTVIANISLSERLKKFKGNYSLSEISLPLQSSFIVKNLLS